MDIAKTIEGYSKDLTSLLDTVIAYVKQLFEAIKKALDGLTKKEGE